MRGFSSSPAQNTPYKKHHHQAWIIHQVRTLLPLIEYDNHRSPPDIVMLGDPQTGLLIVAGGQGSTRLAYPLFYFQELYC